MASKALGYYSHNFKIFNTVEESKQYNWIQQNFNGFIINPNVHLIEKNPFVINQFWMTIDRINFFSRLCLQNQNRQSKFLRVKTVLVE